MPSDLRKRTFGDHVGWAPEPLLIRGFRVRSPGGLPRLGSAWRLAPHEQRVRPTLSSMQLADIPLPDSTVALGARDVLVHYSSTALAHHAERSYRWAMAYALNHSLNVDVELLYVSAMLHDIGLTPSFDSHTVDFEYAGGDVAWAVAAGAGWTVERRQRAADVIVRHMWDSVDPAYDAEGFLLEIATALDISGRDPELWAPAFREEVLAAYPRLDLVNEFTACFRDQAQRKPSSSAARAIESRIDDRLAHNPLDDVHARRDT